MPLILETQDFRINAPDEPHHSREHGGMIVIWPKQIFAHLSEMPLGLAAGFAHLNAVVGEAFMNVMRANGLDVVRINYACFGNWAYKEPAKEPAVHMILYLRTWSEKHPTNDPRFQAFPEALFLPDRTTGYYDSFTPLSQEDCTAIKEEILNLLKTGKYNNVAFEQ